jgi:tripartite ATP-independent transporter DctM subunit
MLITITTFIVSLLIGVPISFSLGVGAVAYLLQKGMSLGIIAQRMFTGLDSIAFIAIPFFIIAGDLMNGAGITKRLVGLSNVLVGRLKGGLAHISIISSMFFGGVSGSAVADASAIGSMMIPPMVESGFDLDFSAAVIASASVMGPIIPPSIPFVVYALLSSTSVAALFLSGVIPGVLIGISLMIVAYFIAKKRNYPRNPKWPTFKEAVQALFQGLVPLLMPVIILGGILSGIFTATEASGIAILYALIIGVLVYRSLSWKKMTEILIASAKLTGVIFLLISASNIFNWSLIIEQVPQKLTMFVSQYIKTPGMLLLVINIVLLIVGTFMEGTAAMIMLVPILLKITAVYSISPIMLGTIVVLNLMIGLITPPVGLCLFVVCGLTKLKIEQLTRAVLPFLAAEIVVLFLVTYIEPLSMWLPRLAGYVK